MTVSPQYELNYTVLLLDRWPARLPTVALAPRDPAPGDPIFVVGYPRGGGLAVALDDNRVVEIPSSARRRAIGDYCDVVAYRAPTEGGSSGSPVFNENWELVAIHMAGDRELNINYGAKLRSVLADARRRLSDLVLEEGVVAMVKGTHDDEVPGDTYLSVFISYSHRDSTFADRLYNALRAKGVRAWYDKREILPGYDIYEEISKGIRQQDKILFCCSETAIKSGWVDSEIDRALQKERSLFKSGSEAGAAKPPRGKALVPLDLDGYLIDGKWESGKAPDLMTRGIADLREWQTQSVFEAAFGRLLEALRSEH